MLPTRKITMLGIDPGTARLGFGIVTVDRHELSAIAYGCVTSPPDMKHAERLKHIYNEIKKIIALHRPSAIAVEKLFFSRNVTTALKVGEARGVALLTSAQAHLPLYEYTPLQIKQAVSGYGQASKLQVQKMVQLLLHLQTLPQPDDAADALAVAITCAHSLPRIDVRGKPPH